MFLVCQVHTVSSYNTKGWGDGSSFLSQFAHLDESFLDSSVVGHGNDFLIKIGPITKRGRGEEKFEICVYTHTYIYQKLDGDPYRITPISIVRPGLETSLRSAIIVDVWRKISFEIA